MTPNNEQLVVHPRELLLRTHCCCCVWLGLAYSQQSGRRRTKRILRIRYTAFFVAPLHPHHHMRRSKRRWRGGVRKKKYSRYISCCVWPRLNIAINFNSHALQGWLRTEENKSETKSYYTWLFGKTSQPVGQGFSAHLSEKL